MEYVTLGTTDLKVSKICLGCMSFGESTKVRPWTLNQEETDAMIDEVRYETDPDKRAEITNEIMQKLYDSHDMLFIGTYNKNSVLKAGANGLGVNNPMQYYGIDANTSL